MRSTPHGRYQNCRTLHADGYQILLHKGGFRNFQKSGQDTTFTASPKPALKMQKPRSPKGDRGWNCRITYLRGYLSSERQIEVQCSLTAECYGVTIKGECVTDNKPAGVNGRSDGPAAG